MNTAKHVYRIIFSFVPELECMEERGKKKNTKKKQKQEERKKLPYVELQSSLLG